MVYLILDTNIWITFVAKNTPPQLLENLIRKADDEEIILLSNEIVLKEWYRNKEKTIKDVRNEIAEIYESIESLSSFLPLEEMKIFKKNIKPYILKKDQITKLAIKRVEQTEELIKKCIMTPITDEMKIKVSNWGIERHAPFIKKASVGDALILLSAVEYCKKNTSGIIDSIFVSWNHTDYTDGENINEIHSELKGLLEEANMIFKRNIGEVLNLTQQMTTKITNYINNELNKQMMTGMSEWDFFDYHNLHIRFRLKDGQEMSGVLIDPMDNELKGKPTTVYDFIPTNNMINYKEAKKNNDIDKINELKFEMDISNIIWAQRI